jgi:hypothetical protein
MKVDKRKIKRAWPDEKLEEEACIKRCLEFLEMTQKKVA